MVLNNWPTVNIGAYLTTLVVTALIVLIGFIIGKLVRRLSQKFLHEADLDKFMNKINFKSSVEEFVSRTLEYFVYFITIVIAIDKLGLTTTMLYIVSGAFLLFIMIAFFLGIKDFFPNLIAGLVLMKKEKVKKGQFIKVGSVEGKVENVDFIETKIKTKNGDLIYVPNSLLYKQDVVVKKARS
ncbi:mechanosensitive ion channel [archaeon]|nr:mechanosensitive ion channel [archaeon]